MPSNCVVYRIEQLQFAYLHHPITSELVRVKTIEKTPSLYIYFSSKSFSCEGDDFVSAHIYYVEKTDEFGLSFAGKIDVNNLPTVCNIQHALH